MLPYQTFTEINLGFFNIQVWGLMTAIGVLIATILAVKRGKKIGVKEEIVYDILFYALISGIIGSRLLYVFENWVYYSNNIIEIFKFWKGGLSFTGGFLLGFTTVYFYLKKHKLNFWQYTDLLAPSIVIGHLFGRIGCYLIGDHLGSPTNLPWGIMQEGALRHPVILYEIIYLAIILFILFKLPKLKNGNLFLLYITMYSFARFINDFFRIDPTYFGLTIAQFLMIIMFINVILFIWFKPK